MQSDYRFVLEELDYGNEEALVIFRDDEDGKRYRAKVEWIEHQPGVLFDREETTMSLKVRRGARRPISGLMISALQDSGELRRAQISDTADLRGWLEDMRKLVFAKGTN